MARTNRVKIDGNAYYHVMSRTSGRQFLFREGRMKDSFIRLLRQSADFSGVELLAFAMMDNHFHFVCRVVKPAGPVPEAEILRRIGVLKGETFAGKLSGRWSDLRTSGQVAKVEQEEAAWLRRMHDLSQFCKTFKELINIAYKDRHEYSGGLFGGRFKSTVIQDGAYLRTCIRYIELNAVRAGLVRRLRDYVWCSHVSEGEPIAGTDPGTGADHAKMVLGEGRLMSRVVQIGSGVIFGSFEFVAGIVERCGRCFTAAHVGPKPVEEGVFSSHGWKRKGRAA